MGGYFVKKSGKCGNVFFVKVDLSSKQGALCTVSVFFILRFTYLGGGVSTHPTHAPAYITTAGRMSLESVPACGEI